MGGIIRVHIKSKPCRFKKVLEEPGKKGKIRR
jgi:hypothetical protein